VDEPAAEPSRGGRAVLVLVRVVRERALSRMGEIDVEVEAPRTLLLLALPVASVRSTYSITPYSVLPAGG
jgi:hypothetical protein